MNTITMERTIHFERRDHGARKVLKSGPGGERAWRDAFPAWRG